MILISDSLSPELALQAKQHVLFQKEMREILDRRENLIAKYLPRKDAWSRLINEDVLAP